MKILYSVLSLILAIAMIAIFVVFAASIEDNLFPADSETTDIVDSGSGVKPPADTSVGSVTTPDTEYVEGPINPNDEFALKLGEGTLNRLVYKNEGSITKYGFKVKGLKANTDYTMQWKLNKNFLSQTNADFIYSNVPDDVNGGSYLAITFIVEQPEHDDLYFAIKASNIETLFDKYLNFETYNGEFTFWFFESPFISNEKDAELASELYRYFESLEFIEEQVAGG